MCSSSERSGKLSAEVIVNVQEDNNLKNDELKTPKYPSNEIETPVVIKVRAEEILILVFVFILWISAIILFFNRWGKIRMLEPYQPLFMDTSQRPSCHISSVDNLIATRPRMSLSKYNVSCDIPSFSTIQNNRNHYHYQSRNRLNSVFVNSNSNQSFDSNYLPRRTKSAIDIHSIKLNEMFVLAKTKSTPIRILNNETVLVAHQQPQQQQQPRRRHSMINSSDYRYSIGFNKTTKLIKNFDLQQQQQQKLPNFRTNRRPSAALSSTSSSSSPVPKRFPFRSFDQPSGHFYDYRRSSLLTSKICSTSTTLPSTSALSLTQTRSNFQTKKILDRIKTLKSFDQPSFIIESPCENETLINNSVIVEVHDETTNNEPPNPKDFIIDSKKTETCIVLANNLVDSSYRTVCNKFQVKKFKRSHSCNDNDNDNDQLNMINGHKFYRKNRHSADDICQM